MIESPYKVDIPVTDVASFVFNSGTPSSRQVPQYFDAASPSKCFSLSEAEGFVKQVAKGLEVLGLRPDDKVLLYSHNRLFFPVLLWGVLAARCVFTAASPTASVSGKNEFMILRRSPILEKGG
jgi:long-subunit acyl-CoA synthetase (AMP-forming)